MNDNSTQPNTAQRNSYMAALSLAEQMISESQTLPTEFTITSQPWSPTEPRLSFYFHDDVQGLRLFRDDQMLAERMETREDGSVYIEAARDDVRGVRVVAWTLTSVASSPVRPDGHGMEVVTLAEAVSLMGALPMPTGSPEDPHDSPLHHDYATTRDLPAQRDGRWTA
ncbi:hypothetical protein [Streptomyces sp. NPDC088730]|uniref:hypothetical protein n=1 Tax=Streptomyces sp. NPDC088730 TaxID=3365877 RepID=UPI003814F585